MPDKLTFGFERLSILLKEPNIRDLLTSYWQELTPLTGHRLDIDWARLLKHEEQGIYRIWTARVNGTLAGFAAFYVQTHVYHKTLLFAVDGGHYLSPAFRNNGRLGYRMWKTVISALKEDGVKVIMAHDNARRPLMPFFLSLGLEPLSTMWIGALDDDTTISW